LKSDVPAGVIAKLKEMCGGPECDVVIEHPLFNTSRWREMFQRSSAYFDAPNRRSSEYDAVSNQWTLSVMSNFKNYDDEIQEFLHWIHPYLDKDDGDFLGYFRYEECESPTFVFYRGE
jgi:hypothetical protein